MGESHKCQSDLEGEELASLLNLIDDCGIYEVIKMKERKVNILKYMYKTSIIDNK